MNGRFPRQRGEQLESELDGEILAHIELAARDLIARGETPEEAFAQARRQFGNVTIVKESARELGRWATLDRFAQDVRHAFRRLRARPATALLAAAMLAAAIGMTSAMFTVVDALILRPAPFRDPESLARLGVGTSDGRYSVNLALPLIRAWRTTSGFAAVHAVTQQSATFGTGEQAQTEGGARVTPGMIDELGATPLLGRTFVAGEGRPGEDDRAIISETIWRTRFGGDPSIVGQRTDISGTSVLIVGVMPSSFAFPFSRTRVWRPLDLDRLPPALSRPRATAYAYVRLAPNVPRQDIARIAADVAHATDPTTAGRGIVLQPIAAGYLDDYSAGTVKVAAVGVGLVFLVLCANVTNLMLARLAARRREFALCSALGASRGRLLGQALWEQLMIGGAAGLLGLAAGAALVTMARAWLPTEILSRTLNPLDLDLRALLATSVVSGLTMVAAGVLPAWIGTRHDALPELQMSSRGATVERKTRRMTTGLLVAELALAVALSVAAGIQLRSFVNMLHEDRGLDAELLSTFEISLPAAQFADGASRYAVAEQIRSSIESLPGVDGATLSFGTPPSAGSLYFYDASSDVPGRAPVHLVMNGYNVTPEFFQVYGIRLLEGRGFQPGDPLDAILVSRSLATTLWPATSAIGRTLRFGTRSLRVIGVTREIRNPTLDPRSDEPELYEQLVPSGQASGANPSDVNAAAHARAGTGASGRAAAGTGASLAATAVSLTVRCDAGCPSFETVRARIKVASSAVTVGAGAYVRDAYATGLARPRAGAVIAIAFAAIALLAVGAGLFAVLTRVALQRQREYGIRLALGATPADLRRLVHSGSLGIAAAGIGAGVILAWTLGRVLASVQYQVRVGDPLTWVVVIVAIGATAFAAAWRPARQAMRVDPVALLRDE